MWESVGTGANDTVFGSLVYEESGIPRLALGGNFTSVDGLVANRVILREGCAICPSDIDGDGVVGFSDLLSILNAWGVCPGCPEDITGVVGFEDLLLLLSDWGVCP